jgi:hypothetical protein
MRSIFALTCLVLFNQSAYAAGRLAEVLLVDRDSGAPLRTYYHHGEYWVAGKPGARYAIEIRNTMHERLLAVTSVDGINVLTGDTAQWNQSGYVLDGEQRYEITGWRKSQAEVAVFEFTALPDSYAARTGRSANVGVIGVAVFRERRPAQVASPPPALAAPAAPPRAENRAQSGTPGAPELDKRADSAGRGDAAAQPGPMAKLGTGHGPREQSSVEFTDFVRTSPQPNEIVRIRYDSRENLLALGIIPRGASPRAAPDPFPGSSLAFVPDPPDL